MGGITREELAQRAGVPTEFVDRLVEHGIVIPADGDAPFARGDVRTVRFVHGLERGGVRLDAVASAVQSGALSFTFFDAAYWERFGGLTGTTYRELSAETGLSLELLHAMRESRGLRPSR
jgi:hypothetical protein